MTGGNFFWLFSVFSPRFVCVHPKRHFKLGRLWGERDRRSADNFLAMANWSADLLHWGRGKATFNLLLYNICTWVPGNHPLSTAGAGNMSNFLPHSTLPLFRSNRFLTDERKDLSFLFNNRHDDLFFLLFAAHRITTDFGLD